MVIVLVAFHYILLMRKVAGSNPARVQLFFLFSEGMQGMTKPSKDGLKIAQFHAIFKTRARPPAMMS